MARFRPPFLLLLCVALGVLMAPQTAFAGATFDRTDHPVKTMFKNILVCLDGSPHSDEALAVAIELASVNDGAIELINAFEAPSEVRPAQQG